MTPHAFLTQALVRWPSFGVEHVFLSRLNSGILEADELAAFMPEDFYVACAAVKGIDGAVAHVDTLLKEQFRSLGHFRLAAHELEEIRASLMQSLVVAGDGALPRLERYLGRGPLAGWLRVVATREVITWLRARARQPVADDEALLGNVEAPAEVPELAVLKEKYRGEFSASFRRAIAKLELRDRNLLRQHYLDELSLEDLAELYRVHRATAARWLASARSSLLTLTRQELAAALGLPAHDVESLMKLLQSRLDFSAGVFLASSR